MFKKKSLLLFALVLALACLSGCGKGKEKSDDSATMEPWEKIQKDRAVYKPIVEDLNGFLAKNVDKLNKDYKSGTYYLYDYDGDDKDELIICFQYINENYKPTTDMAFLDYDGKNVILKAVSYDEKQYRTDFDLYDYNNKLAIYRTTDDGKSTVSTIDVNGETVAFNLEKELDHQLDWSLSETFKAEGLEFVSSDIFSLDGSYLYFGPFE